MELLFEKSRSGRGLSLLPASDVPESKICPCKLRKTPPRLPELSEADLPALHCPVQAGPWAERRLLSPGLLHHEI